METIIRAASLGAASHLLRRPGDAAAAPPVPAAGPDKPVPEAVDGRLAQAQLAASRAAEEARLAAERIAELETREREREAAAAERARQGREELAAARRALEQETEQARAEAERSGHAAGLAEGRQAGEDLLAEETQRLRERVRGLAADLEAARRHAVEEAEDLMVEIAFGAICRVLGQQAAQRASLVDMVRQVSAGALDREQLTVRLHPDDHALLEEGGPLPVRFAADAGVTLGGCLVDGATGTLDARLETQVAALADTLLAVRRARRGESGPA